MGTIVGDIHGQFLDLLQLFEISGPVPETNYLFLGDYGNKGYNSCSTVSLLLLLKARFPAHVTLLRGSADCRQLTQCYGFYDECIFRYHHDGAQVWKWFTDCFDYLPLVAVIENQVLC